jgi:hypothetical protein
MINDGVMGRACPFCDGRSRYVISVELSGGLAADFEVWHCKRCRGVYVLADGPVQILPTQLAAVLQMAHREVRARRPGVARDIRRKAAGIEWAIRMDRAGSGEAGVRYDPAPRP